MDFKQVPAIAAVVFTLTITPVSAEQIAIPLGQQSTHGSTQNLPQYGTKMSQVQRTYGSPRSENSVGAPLITSWVYDKFTVYFEGNTVLRAVLHHQAVSPEQHP
jgi:hypothetical protein